MPRDDRPGADRPSPSWRAPLGRWSLRALDEIQRAQPKLLGWIYRQAQAQPFLRERIEREYDRLLSKLRAELKPYRGRFATYQRLPERGLPANPRVPELGGRCSRPVRAPGKELEVTA